MNPVNARAALPDDLKDMINRIKCDMHHGDKIGLESLLHSFRDIFALKGYPLGRTSIVIHTIHTHDVPPIIKQAPRRVPPHQEDVG